MSKDVKISVLKLEMVNDKKTYKVGCSKSTIFFGMVLMMF